MYVTSAALVQSFPNDKGQMNRLQLERRLQQEEEKWKRVLECMQHLMHFCKVSKVKMVSRISYSLRGDYLNKNEIKIRIGIHAKLLLQIFLNGNAPLNKLQLERRLLP